MSVHALAPRGVPTLSSRIVAEVRDALLEGRHRAGDFFGTEKELAARYGVSRIVARDALRSLEAMGVVDIRPGAGGGARIGRGNPQRFAEALAVQLELAGIEVEEIMVAQHAIECLAAELAAKHACALDVQKLKALVQEAESLIDDVDRFTRSSLAFHLAVAHASHNRVLHYQLVSLQHVSWPMRNRTLTRAVARRVLEAHRDLVRLIEARDASGARELMSEHVHMIGGRRLSEKGRSKTAAFC
jgi:GntR family transcriptional repressor for pyruvate dehydrogenase complex